MEYSHPRYIFKSLQCITRLGSLNNRSYSIRIHAIMWHSVWNLDMVDEVGD